MGRLRRIYEHKYIRSWILVILAIICIFTFEEVVDDVFLDPLEGDMEVEQFDRSITAWFRQFEHPRLTQAMTDFTALGSVSVIIVLFLILTSVLISYRDKRGVLYLSIVTIGAGVWPYVLKLYFMRERPQIAPHLVQVHDLSFPSGHSFGAAAVYVALAFYCAQYAKNIYREILIYLAGLILITLVGTSRIYLGVHYPTDVIGGISAGATWALLVSALFQFLMTRKA